MLRQSLRNLIAHKLRLMLSGFAVVLGVAFISGTMIFTDTLEKTFTDLFETTAADVTVEPKAAFETGLAGTGGGTTRDSVPASAVDLVAGVDGVAAAEGYVQSEGVYVLEESGDVLDTGGAPGIGVSWNEEESLSVSTLTDGRAPEGPDEVALDTGTIEKTGFEVGDTVTLLTTGPRVEAELVGVFRFGEDGGSAGASLAAFDTETAQELLLAPGEFTGISVGTEDGVTNSELSQRIDAALNGAYDVKTRAEQAEDQAASLEEGLSFINTFLLVFAGVALFVGTFIILNTFSMLVAQRTRELALLRALGASRRQVTRSVLIEALVLGVLGSVTGLVVGYGLAHLLKVVFGSFGVTLDGTLVVTGSMIGWSFAVGVLVTLFAAYLPARRAAKVPPIAALRDDHATGQRSLLIRLVAGTVLTAGGAAALLVGATSAEGSTAGLLTGVGALALIVGAITLSPVLAVPFIRLVGAVMPRLAGKTGHLARENALRNPRRTAATSSALMIGLALVTGFSILGASANATINALVDDSLEADFVVSSAMGQPFTPELAAQLSEVEGVETVTQERWGAARIDGEDIFVGAYDADTVTSAVSAEFREGGMDALSRNGLLVDVNVAEGHGWQVGDEVEFQSPTGDERTLEIGGVFEVNQAFGSYVVSLETYEETGGAPLDRYVYVALASGAAADDVRGAIESVTDAFPVVDLKDKDEFAAELRGQVDQMLMLINALLVLSVIIAVLGVVNTLVLSVIERTRELGLLRAVGMTRRQIRRMVRLESVVISVYGAVLGLAVGGFFGVSVVTALEDQGISEMVVPGWQLVLFLLTGAVIGVVAAAFPARRAGRLKVLDAIASH